MVEVKSFKGITYNKEKVVNLEDVMSPPYDIISKEMQDKLYKKHPKNLVRLILNKKESDDNKRKNRYTRAKKLFYQWLDDKILCKSEEDSIYPYKITYNMDNEQKTINGFFILLKLDKDYKQVKAHERTLSGPKKDRLNLMRACKANLEPIQLLYIDEDDIIRKKIDVLIDEPIVDVTGYDDFNHKLWKITDKNTINMICNKLKDDILFIADGHHRYQTAINFSEEMKEETGNSKDDAPFNYRMVILANIFDTGLSILPTHRLIMMKDFDVNALLKNLEKYFEIKEINCNGSPESISKKIMNDIKTENEHMFAMYVKNKYYILNLKDENTMNTFAGDRSETWRTLDVSILHKIVLEHGMGITQDNIEDHVRYTRDDAEAIKFVDNNKFDLSFLMNATKIEELKAIADAGEHMPQKSTYFLPKMLSGLVMYKMDM